MKTFKQYIKEEDELAMEMNFIQQQLEKQLMEYKVGHTMGFRQSTLGGEHNRSLLISYASGVKETVSNGILDNSKIRMRWHISKERNGFLVESFQQNFNFADPSEKPKKFRKVSKATKEKAVQSIVKWFDTNKKILLNIVG